MIARNEASCIDRALESVKGFDEIIVVDTGSDDRTVEIAQSRGATVHDFEWVDNFAAARNFAIEKATGDWIVSIDADHVLLTPAHEVRGIIEGAVGQGHRALYCETTWPSNPQFKHWFAVIFHRDVRWIGRVHEVLDTPAVRVPIVYEIHHSEAKNRDPDRNLRILQKSDKTQARTQFYIAREYADRGKHEPAIHWMQEYLANTGKYQPEICEAHMTIAKGCWALGLGDLARRAAMQAVIENPMCKEALLLMADYYAEPWRTRWKTLASAATNEGVLFIRAP